MTSVCYILSYHDPNYNRTRTLISALRQIENIELYEARNSSKGLGRYFETLWKLIVIRISKKTDFYLLGFRGYEIFWPVRILTLGKTLIYDQMMSPYDSLLNERNLIKKGGLIEKLIYLYERSILCFADIVLTDTDIHKRYFQELFDIEPNKILAVPIGADEEFFHIDHVKSYEKSSIFEVLFYGTFLPLHGINVILGAASRLREYRIHFTLIGRNKSNRYYRTIDETAQDNVTHIEWIEFEDLPKLIAQADLGLGGPFGSTGQAHRVLTGKTFQFLAMAKPVIVGEFADDYGFKNKVNCLVVPQGDEQALAQAIYWAFLHKAQLDQIGQEGYELFETRYSTEKNSKKLSKAFDL